MVSFGLQMVSRNEDDQGDSLYLRKLHINDEIDKFNKDMQSIFSMILFFYRKMVILGNWAKNRKEHHSWLKDDA